MGKDRERERERERERDEMKAKRLEKGARKSCADEQCVDMKTSRACTNVGVLMWGLDLQILKADFQKEILNSRLQNIYSASDSLRYFLPEFPIPNSKIALSIHCDNWVHLTD